VAWPVLDVGAVEVADVLDVPDEAPEPTGDELEFDVVEVVPAVEEAPLEGVLEVVAWVVSDAATEARAAARTTPVAPVMTVSFRRGDSVMGTP
jgi:hypothetical protein